MGDLRRARARELLESRGKARNNSTTAAGARSIIAVLYASGEDCRLAELECAVRQPVRKWSAEAQMQSHEDNNASRPSLPAFDLSKS